MLDFSSVIVRRAVCAEAIPQHARRLLRSARNDKCSIVKLFASSIARWYNRTILEYVRAIQLSDWDLQKNSFPLLQSHLSILSGCGMW
jgi:hypothetical protein